MAKRLLFGTAGVLLTLLFTLALLEGALRVYSDGLTKVTVPHRTTMGMGRLALRALCGVLQIGRTVD